MHYVIRLYFRNAVMLYCRFYNENVNLPVRSCDASEELSEKELTEQAKSGESLLRSREDAAGVMSLAQPETPGAATALTGAEPDTSAEAGTGKAILVAQEAGGGGGATSSLGGEVAEDLVGSGTGHIRGAAGSSGSTAVVAMEASAASVE
eukprot:gene21000-25197_t